MGRIVGQLFNFIHIITTSIIWPKQNDILTVSSGKLPLKILQVRYIASYIIYQIIGIALYCNAHL